MIEARFLRATAAVFPRERAVSPTKSTPQKFSPPLSPAAAQEDTFTVDDDVDMDEGGGGEMVSDEFDFEVDGNVSDSIDI